MFRNLFPIPNETHSLSAPISLKNDIPSTIMSVSFTIISIHWYPCDTAFAAYNITHLSNSSWLHGLSGYSHSSAPAHDSPMHLHPELILQPFLHRRRSELWLLTDNGTVPPCYLLSADSCSNFSEIPHSHHVVSAL